MTRNYVPFAWGLALGVAMCFGLWVIAFLVALGGDSTFIPTLSAYLWPSSLLLVRDIEDHPTIFWIVLVISVAVNALLYGGIFVFVRVFTRWLRRRRSKRLTNRCS
jgi:hypothetical protein